MMWKVKDSEAGMSLGSFIKSKVNFSAKEIKAALEKGAAKINGETERFNSCRVRLKDVVHFFPPKKEETSLLDENLILFEDENLLAYNKPSHITTEKLLELLQERCPSLLAVHRLDKETSGVILFAKSAEFKSEIENAFKERHVEKIYLAIVEGHLDPKEGVIKNQLGLKKEVHGKSFYGSVAGGQYAESAYCVEKEGSGVSLVKCMPKTGRTHQIRVHMNSLGHPILGDHHYGRHFKTEIKTDRILLHAFSIKFPYQNKKLTIKAPLPKDFKEPYSKLFGK